jgi:hypothetical protein
VNSQPHAAVARLLTPVPCLLFPVACLLLALGCADPNVGTVSGTVTVDGAAPKEGWIGFFPTDGKSTPAGAEILDGRYTVDAPIGPSKVEIRVPKITGHKKLYDTPDSPMKPIMTELLPAKYNDATELTFDVQPGENPKDFALTTQ